MKTIVETGTNVSKYLINDDVVVETTTEKIAVGSPVQFNIHDLNDSSSTVYANVTNAPSDWVGNKYTFDGTTWAANPNWAEPPQLDDL